MRVLPLRTPNVAVDLGTANTVVHAAPGDVLICEPSVVSVRPDTGEVLGVGRVALEDVERDGTTPVRPLRAGVVDDAELAGQMLRGFLGGLVAHRWAYPRVVACVPSAASSVERGALVDACLAAGARKVSLIAKPLAAASGAGLRVDEPTGSMVLDVGAGTTEVAVVSAGGIVASASLRIGGDEFDAAIVSHLRREHRLLITAADAEAIKLRIGSVDPGEGAQYTHVTGRDLATRQPATARVTTAEISRALARPLSRILDAATDTLGRLPPELAWDVVDRGIVLTGGGALLGGLAQRVSAATGVPVRRAARPHTSAAVGAARCRQEHPPAPASGGPGRVAMPGTVVLQ